MTKPLAAILAAAALALALPSQAEQGAANLDTPKIVVPARPDVLKSSRPVRLGIPYISVPNSESSLLRDTVAWLRQQFGDQLVVLPYSETDLRAAVSGGELDLFIESSGFFWEFSNAGARALATLADAWKENPNSSAAAAVVVRRSRTDIVSLADLAGRKIAAGADDFYSGWQMLDYEVRRQSRREAPRLGKAAFTGMPLSQVVDRVLSGEADAGVLTACYLENLIASHYPGAEQLRVLSPQNDGMRCRHSTRTYPGLTLATMPSANPATMREISRALFAMPPSGPDAAVWSIATSFKEADGLLKTLGLGPYRHLSEWTVDRFLEKYWHWLVLLVLAGAGMLVHAVRTEHVVRQRTRQLRAALAEQRRMEADAREKSSRLEALERESVVQQLSSMLAHELRQPMTAIGFYTKGLISRLRRGEFSADDYLSVLEKIRDLNQKSNSIVEHVRGYAKANVNRRETDLSALAEQAVRNLMEARFQHTSVRVRALIEPHIRLAADGFEIELIISNLLKNAIEACRGAPNAEVTVSVSAAEGTPRGALIRVSDNGPALSPEAIGRLGLPFQSTKADGLGLGTSIVRRIAESYGGSLVYKARSPRGLTAEVRLWDPMSAPDEREN